MFIQPVNTNMGERLGNIIEILKFDVNIYMTKYIFEAQFQKY